MSYKDFTLDDIKKLGYRVEREKKIFERRNVKVPQETLTFINAVKRIHFSSSSEIAKREGSIFPILVGFCLNNKEKICLHSGEPFNVDISKGLNGQVDYAITGDTKAPDITAPIIIIVEAKKGDIEQDAPQCMAEMIAAQIINESANIHKAIYGIVTTGNMWSVLKLEEKTLHWEEDPYYIIEDEQIMGVMQTMLDEFLK